MYEPWYGIIGEEFKLVSWSGVSFALVYHVLLLIEVSSTPFGTAQRSFESAERVKRWTSYIIAAVKIWHFLDSALTHIRELEDKIVGPSEII